jgi:DNA-binding response OmpR family regulator
MSEKKETRILLIEDEESIANLVKFYLRSYRDRIFKVDWVDTAEKGVDKIVIDKNHYDLIILDYYLPGMNGLEAFKAFKAKSIDIPVIFLTGAKDDEIAIEALKAGILDYYSKEDILGPLLPAIVTSSIERAYLKKQLDIAEKDKGKETQKVEAIQEFVITISHEVNNPLAAIKLAANILMKRDLAPEITTYVKIIKENTDRIEQTILKLRELKSDRIVPYVGKLQMFDLSDETTNKETKRD